MAANRTNGVLEYLRQTVLRQDGAGLTDGQLLGCFLEQGDEAALAALVRRHGPLVWSICRRILGNHHDAEDAFQATFLVLVRRAASVVPREMVANWLYGVASQTARKAKAALAKRRTRETRMEQLPEPAVSDADSGNELLHRALSGLPAKFRAALILCYLEGKTHKEAARHLDVPEGTLASWLARGRALLAKRLSRQGLTLSSGALTAALLQSAVSASVPVFLASSTRKAVALLATGQAIADVVSTRVVFLMEGVIKGMLATNIKRTMTVVLAAIVTAGLGSGGLAYRMYAAEREAPRESSQTDEQQPPIRKEAASEQVTIVVRDNSDKNTLVGSGKEGKKDIKVADFDALDIHLPIQVSVQQGKTFRVVISGDDNLLDVVKGDKDGSTLKLSNAKRSWRTSHPLKATITMPALERVHLNAASRMTIQGFKSTKDFNAKVTSASKLEGAIEAGNVKLDASDGCTVMLKGTAKKAALSASSGCNLQLEGFTLEEAKVAATGGSTVKVKGSAKKAVLSGSGGCNLQLGDFALEEAAVKLSGGCSAIVAVKTKLDYSLSGACNLRYQGDPKIGKAETSGASSARRKKE